MLKSNSINMADHSFDNSFTITDCCAVRPVYELVRTTSMAIILIHYTNYIGTNDTVDFIWSFIFMG